MNKGELGNRERTSGNKAEKEEAEERKTHSERERKKDSQKE